MEKYLLALRNNGKPEIDRLKQVFHVKNVKSFSEFQKKPVDPPHRRHKPNKSTMQPNKPPQSNKTINVMTEDPQHGLSHFGKKISVEKKESQRKKSLNPVVRHATSRVLTSISRDNSKLKKLQKTSESTNKRIKTSVSTNKREANGTDDGSNCHKPSVFLNTSNSRHEQRFPVKRMPPSAPKQPKKDLITILKGFKEETLLMQKRQVRNSMANYAIFQKIKEKTVRTQPSYMEKLNKLFKNKSPSNKMNSRIKEIKTKYFKDTYVGLNSHANKKPFCASILASPQLYEKLDARVLIEIEEILLRFVNAAYKGEDIYDLFKSYVDYVQDNDVQPFLNLITCGSMQDLYKNSIVLERLALMTCFYLLIHDYYENEIGMIKKLLVCLYSNYYALITMLLNDPNCWGLFTVR